MDKSLVKALRQGASFGMDMIPVVGTGKAAQQLATGYDYVADEPVDRRWEAAGLIPFGKVGGKVAKIFGGELGANKDQLAALAKAKELDAKGVDPWEETGWFRGLDGKWRFEIPDFDAAIKPLMPGKHTMTKEELMRHPEAWKAYPDIAAQKVDVDIHDSPFISGGAHYPEEFRSELVYGDRLRGRSSALHEIQHAVQTKEGFAPGGSPQEEAGKYLAAVLKGGTLPKNKKERERILDEAYEVGMKRYRALPGEVEARAVEARRNLPPEVLKKRNPLIDFAKVSK